MAFYSSFDIEGLVRRSVGWMFCLAGLVGLSGCYNPRACESEEDCFGGQVCQQGTCTPVAAGDDTRVRTDDTAVGGRDGDERDTRDGEPPDTGRPPAETGTDTSDDCPTGSAGSACTPVVSIDSPNDGTSVCATFETRVSLDDPDGVADKIRLSLLAGPNQVSTASIGTLDGGPYAAELTTDGEGDGRYTVRASAFKGAKKVAEDELSVTVDTQREACRVTGCLGPESECKTEAGRFGGHGLLDTNPAHEVVVETVAAAPDGSAYLGGRFKETLELCGRTVADPDGINWTGFIAKYRVEPGSPTCEWVKRFKGDELEVVSQLDVSGGDVYFAGLCRDGILEPGGVDCNVDGTYMWGGRLTGDGRLKWAKTFAKNHDAVDIAARGSHVVVLGDSRKDGEFWLKSYETSGGSAVWNESVTSADEQWAGSGVAIESGRALLVGAVDGAETGFGDVYGPNGDTSAVGRSDSTDGFLAAFDVATGDLQGAAAFGDSANVDVPVEIVLANGTLYTLLAIGGTAHDHCGGGDVSNDMAVAKLGTTPSGQRMSADSLVCLSGPDYDSSTLDYDRPVDVAVDADERVFVSGEFQKTLDLDPDTSSEDREIRGANDDSNRFIAAYTPSGDYRWHLTMTTDSKRDFRKGPRLEAAADEPGLLASVTANRIDTISVAGSAYNTSHALEVQADEKRGLFFTMFR